MTRLFQGQPEFISRGLRVIWLRTALTPSQQGQGESAEGRERREQDCESGVM